VFDAGVARRIRLLGLDVDGVLTDNDTYIGQINGDRVEFKRYDIQDGFGIRLLRGTPIEVAWITGRAAASTELRASELRVPHVIQVDAGAKENAVADLLARQHLDWSEMAYVGDDIADLPVLKRVGLPIAVANARDEIKAACRHVTVARGGHGAVREVIDGLLKARGEFDAAVARVFAPIEAAR
jgi:3-deoxy-D-manno-octulosonate 8-phosphate phosphatase (KDO 8-P phosphatase)